jgi:peptidyl-tRNA hydrolase, PTH1 family
VEANPQGRLLIPRLIVGLGNPGDSYRDTRHNVGFMVLDEVVNRLSVSFQWEKRWVTDLARSGPTWFSKPQTFMNASGEAVTHVTRFHKIDPAEVLVIYDDVDLALGSLRLRAEGSAGGHNGMKSLIQRLGSNAFPRLKLGIAGNSGRPSGERLSGHVLGKFSPDERPILVEMVQRAADAVLHSLSHGFDAAMNLFNRKPQPN